MVNFVEVKRFSLSATDFAYVSPVAKVVSFESEGVVCSSIMTIDNEDFVDGGSYEI